MNPYFCQQEINPKQDVFLSTGLLTKNGKKSKLNGNK